MFYRWSAVAAGIIYCVSVASEAKGDTCVVSASVTGDSAAAADIRRGLRERNIEDTRLGDCPFVQVAVRRSASGITLAITDETGRVTTRTASGVASAVNLIDAWVRQGLPIIESGLSPEKPPPMPSSPPRTSLASVGLGPVIGVGFDASLWFGGKIPATFFVGPVGLGVSISAATDPHMTGISKSLRTARTLLDLFAFIEFPIIGKPRFYARPGLGLGASFLFAKTVATVTLTSSDESDDTETEDEVETEDGITVTGYADYREATFVVGAHMVTGVRLSRGFSFIQGISVSIYPLADTDQRVDTVSSIRSAGAPRGTVFFTLGLEYSL